MGREETLALLAAALGELIQVAVDCKIVDESEMDSPLWKLIWKHPDDLSRANTREYHREMLGLATMKCSEAIHNRLPELDRWDVIAADAALLITDLEIAFRNFSEQPSVGSEMAFRRHAENRSMREEALEYWRKHIDSNLSAQKAATELLKVVPLSHKKLAEIIAAERRKKPD